MNTTSLKRLGQWAALWLVLALVLAAGVLHRFNQAGDALIDMIVRTANGRFTSAEALGHQEFVMTKLYRSA